jgi:hypothetical protein
MPVNRIQERVRDEIGMLPDHLRRWAAGHLTTPRPVHALLVPDGKEAIDLWLVSDDRGDRDSSSRVVYDANQDSFGLVQQLHDGTLWFMGTYGSFAEAVEGM